jgi:hypothetical protein
METAGMTLVRAAENLMKKTILHSFLHSTDGINAPTGWNDWL